MSTRIRCGRGSQTQCISSMVTSLARLRLSRSTSAPRTGEALAELRDKCLPDFLELKEPRRQSEKKDKGYDEEYQCNEGFFHLQFALNEKGVPGQNSLKQDQRFI